MRRWETFAALLAVTLASLSSVPIAGRPRPLLAVCAILLLGIVLYARLRAQFFSRRTPPPKLDAYERALRIQEERERKYWH